MSKADGIGFGAWKAFERFFHGYFEIVTALALSFYLLSVTLSHSLASGCFVLVRRLSGLSFGQFHGSFCYFCLLSFLLHKVFESIGDFNWSVLCLATKSLPSGLYVFGIGISSRFLQSVLCPWFLRRVLPRLFLQSWVWILKRRFGAYFGLRFLLWLIVMRS